MDPWQPHPGVTQPFGWCLPHPAEARVGTGALCAHWGGAIVSTKPGTFHTDVSIGN